MFEAAIRLLDDDDPESVSTNAIARLAGVSIGTLYQYFPDKETVFRELAQRELVGLAERIESIMSGPAPERPGGRITSVLAAVLDAYGGRGAAHRRLMKHSLSRGSTGIMGPLLQRLQRSFSREGVRGPDRTLPPLSQADAFVLTQAVNGVMQSAVTADPDTYGGRRNLEAALTRLILSFLAPAVTASNAHD